MKKTIYVFSCVLVFLLLLASCRVETLMGSAPTTEGTTTNPQPGFSSTQPGTAIPQPGTTVTQPGTTVTQPETTAPTPTVTVPPIETTVPHPSTTIPTEPTTAPTTPPVKNYTLELSLKGDGIVTLEYGSEYTDEGATVRLLCDGMPVPEEQIPEVIVDSILDTGKTGTYVITYIVVFDTGRELLRAQAERTVHIVDTQAPVINLITDPNGFTYPGHAYVEEGYTAIDGYDGDITARVERIEENGIVTYRVSDAAGNETVVTRTIRYEDPICPELTLQGENPMVIKIGKDYVEPGYEAVDGCDGDLTQQVTAKGEINKWIAGSYVITYTVQDAAGNVATAERTVIVEHVKNGNVIYLTFDDGPSQHTPRLLEILDKYQVKATFFVVNTYYIRYVDDIVKNGHSIGVHSTTHDFHEIYASEEAYFADLENLRNIIHKRTGVYTNLIRFPGGSSNTISKFNPGIMTRLTKLVEQKGYHYFDWNVSSGDAGSVFTADAVYDRVTKGCKNRKNSIVLQHDIKGFSVDAVERIIQWGLENGYTFLPLNESSPKSHHSVLN